MAFEEVGTQGNRSFCSFTSTPVEPEKNIIVSHHYFCPSGGHRNDATFFGLGAIASIAEKVTVVDADTVRLVNEINRPETETSIASATATSGDDLRFLLR